MVLPQSTDPRNDIPYGLSALNISVPPNFHCGSKKWPSLGSIIYPFSYQFHKQGRRNFLKADPSIVD